MPTFAHLDNRKRINLSQFATSDIYLISTEPNGRITLEPAEVVSQLERDVQANPAAMAAIAGYLADPSSTIPEDSTSRRGVA